MSKKVKAYISVLLTVLLSATMISITAFASTGTSGPADRTVVSHEAAQGPVDPGTGNTAPGGTITPDPGDSSNAGSGPSTSSEQSSTPDQSSSSEAASSSQPPATGSLQVTLDFNGGTGGQNVVTVLYGTPVDALATPTRKGYQFSGWSMGGNLVSSSMKITQDLFLTAQWKEEVTSSASSEAPTSSYKPVDTHQSEVDQAASRAEAAISEPDTLSSQDWGSLLSSGSSSDAVGALGSQTASSAAQSASGGLSKLFLIGMGLILLALIGIGLFVFLQFFQGRKHPPRGGSGRGPGDDTSEFTDISSYSDGGSPDEEFDNWEPNGTNDPTPPADWGEEPVKAGQQADTQKTARFDIPAEYAQPKAPGKQNSEYSWDKFFDNDF